MSTDRRAFLRYTLAAGAALTTGRTLAAGAPRPASATGSAKLKVLVFGGTGFIGPKLVAHALQRGHEVVLFNRGKTNTHLFPELEKIVGDRNPAKGEGLKGLEGRSFDLVFDDSGYYPKHVAASAQMLAKAGSGHYVYVSSVSAYASVAKPDQDEDAPLGVLTDPDTETMGKSYENYGPLKAACEQAVQKAFEKRCTVIRPGYIVGPGDPTDRFTYWPVRMSRGGKAIVPGTPEDPLQVIDVRDLAEWMVHVGEAKVLGTFNAVGGSKPYRWGEVIEACRKAAKAPAEVRWTSQAELEEHKVPGFPIWAPGDGEYAGIHRVRNERAVAQGLRFRPLEAICKDTLEWFEGLPEERRTAFKLPLSAEQEAELVKKLG